MDGSAAGGGDRRRRCRHRARARTSSVSSTSRTCNGSSPLQWNATTAAWLLAGGAGSGRTTALRALALAAARRSGPESLHVHVIDGHGSLADLGALPHLGTSARVDDVRGLHLPRAAPARRGRPAPRGSGGPAARSIGSDRGPEPRTHLEHRRRRRSCCSSTAGSSSSRHTRPTGPSPLTGTLLRVLRDGRSVGVVGAVTGGRSLLHPRWGEVAGRTFLMGRIDPLDAALAGLRTTDAPRDPPPGRAVRVHDRREVQFAQVTRFRDRRPFARGPARRPAHGAAWRWVGLPTVVRRASRCHPPPARRASTSTSTTARELLLGVGGEHATSFSWRPETDGRRLLVVGPPRSGRTNALRVIAESLCARQAGSSPLWPRSTVAGCRGR